MNRIGLAVVGVGLATVLTSCSDGETFTDQSGDAIAQDAKEAMRDLSAVQVSGTVTTDGRAITLDVQISAESDCTGTIQIGDGTAEIVGSGGAVWFRPNEAYWLANGGEDAEEVMAVVGDKWVVVPPGEDGIDQFCDLDRMLDALLESAEEDEAATFSTGGTSEIDGQEVVAIDREDEEGASTGYVLTDAPHFLVKVEKTDGGDTGTIIFAAFDEEFDVAAPAEVDVIDLTNLGS